MSIMAATAATTRRWSIAAHPLSLGGGGDSSAHAHLPLTQRPLDLFFVFYFITHVPTSVLVDAQCVLPPENFPQAARDALAYHLETFKDPLMGTCPAWLRSIIWCELALQVPFFHSRDLRLLRAQELDPDALHRVRSAHRHDARSDP